MPTRLHYRGHHLLSPERRGPYPYCPRAPEGSRAMRTSDHENFDFRVWGICPGEQVSSEIRRSLRGPVCFGVPGPSLQDKEMAVSK